MDMEHKLGYGCAAIILIVLLAVIVKCYSDDTGYSSSKSTFEKATGITKKEYQRRLNNY